MTPPTDAAARLAAVVGPHEVRGTAAAPLTADLVAALAAAFVDEVGAQSREVLIGYAGSEPVDLVAAFTRGAQSRGATVVDLGRCGSDQIRFGSGTLNAPAAFISVPPGAGAALTVLRAGALEVSLDHGLGAIRDRAIAYLADGPMPVTVPGGRRELDLLADYAAALRALVGLRGIRPLTVVVDAGGGAASASAPAVLGNPNATAPEAIALPVTVVSLPFTPDPEPHLVDLAAPATLVDLKNAVIQHDADLGLGFDTDAGRCVVIDETGSVVAPSAIGAILCRRQIERARAENPGQDLSVLYDHTVSRVVPETIEAAGAHALPTPVGGELMRAELRATGAVFGCGHSGDYFFPSFWSADSGLLAALQVLAEVGSQPRPLSELATDALPYSHSGEIGCSVESVPAVYARIVDTWMGDADFEEFDGLTVTGMTSADEAFWWLNVRLATSDEAMEPGQQPALESVLCLTVEAATPEVMVRIRDEALALIQGA
ncbi:phosphomannomutase/phosphoglucomutase [Cryobacterium cryoconiti]|uniref:Phosphomannomutase/phosphoglucomutase n=1 Tax=Cryobacterium cryoconiti TaxID=1259239 RepID=A0A4Y8JT74_9MICO|nr:phosphomannomutase/phosphoglucomutase [Cryobacterium cryoconiti]TFD29438.1 phosphomannomutase/phosphoglucomutase [Cryobacterium cryoconiti]